MGIYRPRSPKKSPFYQCIADYFEEFVQVYDERYEREYGFWRPVIAEVIEKFLECGDLTHGFAHICCDHCGHEYLLGFTSGRLRLLRRKIQIVFQDPYASLNPRMNVESIIGEPSLVHKICHGRVERRKRVEYLLEKVGLSSESMKRYPHEFSGGQRQRVGIARALSLNPELIVADEPVSALDVSVRAQVINLFQDLQKEFGLSYLFIAHDLSLIRHISDHVAVMYLGKLAEKAEAESIFESPLHPYTKCLISAVPIPNPDTRSNRIILKGDVPSPMAPPPGCRFHTRCPYKMPICSEEEPVMKEVKKGHEVACHLVK